MKRKTIILVVILLLGAAGSAGLVWRGSQDTDGQSQLAASPQATDDRLVAEGKVIPVQHALLSLPTGGIVSTIHVAEGDTVQSGQPLLGLDRARAEANVAQARANLTESQAAYEKLRAGAPILHLADLSTWQIATTDLTELDVIRVRMGSPVTMTFDAIAGLELRGRVSHMRPIGENKQGDITYVVRVTPDQQDARLRWNMTAAVSITDT